MGRALRPVEPADGPVKSFALELRHLWEGAGSPTFLAMSRRTGRSRTALSEAVGGDHLPTWETVEAFVTGCGGDVPTWRRRYAEVAAQVRRPDAPATTTPGAAGEASTARSADPGGEPVGHDAAVPAVPQDASPPEDGAPVGGRRRARLVALVTVALLAVTAGTTAAVTLSDDEDPLDVIVVQNKVAIGPDTLVEDVSPSYLSSRPVSLCTQRGCKLEGTDVFSGAALVAECHVRGEEVTNADLTSPGIEDNPEAVTSSLWYRVRMAKPDVVGYIPEIYVEPQHRGGIGLPRCRD